MDKTNKKYMFLDDLLESLRSNGTITDYLIDNESGILSYDINGKHIETDICVHVWHEVGDELPRVKTRRIITDYNDRTKKFIKKLSEGTANDHEYGLVGFIEKESNLSQDGCCLVIDNAYVYGNVRICGGVSLENNVRVFDNAKV